MNRDKYYKKKTEQTGENIEKENKVGGEGRRRRRKGKKEDNEEDEGKTSDALGPKGLNSGSITDKPAVAYTVFPQPIVFRWVSLIFES